LLATLKEQVKNNQYAEATQTSVILAEIHQELGQASQAATYFKNAIGYAEKSKQKRLIALAYEKEGDFLLAHIDLNKKIKNYQTANKLYQESQDTVGMASTLKKLAKYHFEAKFFAKVPAYSQVLLDNAEEYALSSFEELSHYKALIISYIRLGKIQKVKEYLTLWKNIKKEGLTSISYNPDTDFDEEILAKEFDEALAEKVKRDYENGSISERMKALLSIAASVQKGGKFVTESRVGKAKNLGAGDIEIYDTVC
jgi:hypothetical protein